MRESYTTIEEQIVLQKLSATNGYLNGDVRNVDGELHDTTALDLGAQNLAENTQIEVIPNYNPDAPWSILSQRLPHQIDKNGEIYLSIGGLAYALLPAVRNLPQSRWFGNPGHNIEDIIREDGDKITYDKDNNLKVVSAEGKEKPTLYRDSNSVEAEIAPVVQSYAESTDLGYEAKLYFLSEEQWKRFYGDMANDVMWPHQHQQHKYQVGDEFLYTAVRNENATFLKEAMHGYNEVNRGVARMMSQELSPEENVFVNDYHFYGVAEELRHLGVNNHLRFFLHIPLPSEDSFAQLPDFIQKKMVEGLLHYDVVGLQTSKDVNRFIDMVNLANETWNLGAYIHDIEEGGLAIEWNGRRTLLKDFPVGNDADELGAMTEDPVVSETKERLNKIIDGRRSMGLLGRMDCPKGYKESVDMMEYLLENGLVTADEMVMTIVAADARPVVSAQQYQKYVHERINQVNEKFSKNGKKPIEFIRGFNGRNGFSRPEVRAFWETVDYPCIPSVDEGHGLVVREAIALSKESAVVLVGKDVGAAQVFGDTVYSFDPKNPAQFSESVLQAMNLPEEQRITMDIEGKKINNEHTNDKWVHGFLNFGK